MTSYTIIPDVHADPDRLERSLALAENGSRIAFLGDFIDAGSKVSAPDDAAVLDRVSALLEEERAVAVMGNHELNALLFHRFDSGGQPLRPHIGKNLDQHRSFCTRFGIGTREAVDRTRRFLDLPLWLDLDGLRLVHACWNSRAIATIAERRPDGRLHEEDLEEVAGKSSPFAQAVDLLVSGPEVSLPETYAFHDNGGHLRTEVRIAWWRADASTWRDAALSVKDPEQLPDAPIDAMPDLEFYGAENPPVLVGHYKMLGAPRIESAQAACLDYPDRPCVYLWAGEEELTPKNLHEIAR